MNSSDEITPGTLLIWHYNEYVDPADSISIILCRSERGYEVLLNNGKLDWISHALFKGRTPFVVQQIGDAYIITSTSNKYLHI